MELGLSIGHSAYYFFYYKPVILAVTIIFPTFLRLIGIPFRYSDCSETFMFWNIVTSIESINSLIIKNNLS